MLTRRIVINDRGDTIPAHLAEIEDKEGILYKIDIDDVEWVITDNRMHALVLFQMIAEHITEYYHYELNK